MKRYKKGSVTFEVLEHSDLLTSKMIEHPDGEWVRYTDINNEQGDRCDCCGEYGQDRRTLSMACEYNMDELDIPFTKKVFENVPSFGKDSLYTLLVCKSCRADWLEAIMVWFKIGGKHGI